MDVVNYLQTHDFYILVYVFFTLGMLAEGLLFALTVMFFINIGVVEPLPALLSVGVGAMLEQWLFYHVGTRLTNFPRITNWVNQVAQKFDKHIQNRTLHTLLISKFVYCFHRAILIRSGMLKLPRAQFFKASVISTSLWLLVIGALSYYFSVYLIKFAKYSNLVDALPFILIAVFLVIERVAGKYFKRWL